MTRLRPLFVAPVAALMFVLSLASAGAQDRLSAMPGYDQFSKMSPQIAGSWTSGAVAGTWTADGRLDLHHRGQVVSIRPRHAQGDRDGRRARGGCRPRRRARRRRARTEPAAPP